MNSTPSPDERTAHLLGYIDGGYMAFDPGIEAEPEQSHSDTSLWCFNHARKLTNPTISLFCGVLKECPEAKLYLKSISFHEREEQKRIRRRFEQHGIESERLVILDWVNGGLNHLACYNLIDAALDPLPYGGATTTAEALWMGVPVVTQRQLGMAGCLSTSLLSFGNQKQWIANTHEEYLQIAQKLFTNGPRCKDDRMQLRYEMQKSPVGNAKRLSHELESHYCDLLEHAAQPLH